MATVSLSSLASCMVCRDILASQPRQIAKHARFLSRQHKQLPGRACSSMNIPWKTKLLNISSRYDQYRYCSASSQRQIVTEINGETIIRSPYPDIESTDMPFGEFIFGCLDEYKNLELMVDNPTGRRFTGTQLKDFAVRIASGLARLGFKKGDVILMFSTNCPEYTMVFIACSLLGVVVSTANPVYTPGELGRQLTHCESKAVFTSTAMLPTVVEALATNEDAHNEVKVIFTLDGSADGCCPIQNLLDDNGEFFPENVDILSDEDILTLPYSSGTTGLPKGVMLTHKNMVMNLLQSKHGQVKLRADKEVLMGLLPFYHIYGLMVLQFCTLTQGAKIIVLPKFEPETFLQSIEKHKITYAHIVPPIALFLAKHPLVDDYNTSSLETLVCAAAPLGLGVSNEVEERLGVNLLQAYGLTETSPIINYDETPHRRGTIGQLIPSTIAKVVDTETGKVLPVGEDGEIVVKGPQVMKGYLKNPESTQSTIKDGWLFTGDIGSTDNDGYFKVSDRLKELIKYKAYQVAPAELEALLCTYPAVQDAAVIGLQAGEDVGEIPKAFVVFKPGEQVKQQDILDFVEKNVAPYKKLRGGVEFVTEIPKTASGKILRRILRDRTN